MDGLHDFFRWLNRWGEIPEIPTWPEMEEVVQKEKKALSREEQEKCLAMIPEKQRDIIEFMMEAGLRPSEACALMTIDIDRKRRGAIFRRTYSEGKLRNKTKNQRKEYVLVLSDRAWELVERNMKTLQSEPGWTGGYYLPLLKQGRWSPLRRRGGQPSGRPSDRHGRGAAPSG